MVAENGTDGVSTTAPNPAYVSRDELLSLRVVVGARRIFLALCENDRGRYLKISDGRNKLIVPGSGISDFQAAIDSLHEYVTNHPANEPQTSEPPSSSAASGSGTRRPPEPLHAERFISEGRKFYLDLLENERGQYVKISQATTRRISMTFPSAGLRHLREAMAQLDDLAPPDPAELNPSPTGHTTRTVERQTSLQNGGVVAMKAVQREIRIEGKRVVFESGANRRGSYLRITENSGISKMSVTVPHSCISSIISLLKEVEESGDPLNDLRAAEAAAESNSQGQ